jgi:hypothetical protein
VVPDRVPPQPVTLAV